MQAREAHNRIIQMYQLQKEQVSSECCVCLDSMNRGIAADIDVVMCCICEVVWVHRECLDKLLLNDPGAMQEMKDNPDTRNNRTDEPDEILISRRPSQRLSEVNSASAKGPAGILSRQRWKCQECADRVEKIRESNYGSLKSKKDKICYLRIVLDSYFNDSV